MKKLLNKKVSKMTVKDLKESLENYDDDSDVILCFNMKDESIHYCYLAEVLNIKYDGVLKEKMLKPIVELNGFKHEYCTYKEKQ